MNTSPRKVGGLTFVELLVVITVAAILASIAFPDFVGLIKNNRSATEINDVLSSLTLARSEAVKRNTSVAVCSSADGAACLDSGEAWQNGWIVFEDPDGNGVVADPADVISVYGELPGDRSLTFTPEFVVYESSGMATAGGNSTFILCDDRGDSSARGLILSASGRPRVAVDSDESGVVEDVAGDDVTCGS